MVQSTADTEDEYSLSINFALGTPHESIHDYSLNNISSILSTSSIASEDTNTDDREEESKYAMVCTHATRTWMRDMSNASEEARTPQKPHLQFYPVLDDVRQEVTRKPIQIDTVTGRGNLMTSLLHNSLAILTWTQKWGEGNGYRQSIRTQLTTRPRVSGNLSLRLPTPVLPDMET